VNVKWLISDIVDYEPPVKYDVWYDKAAFHFQTGKKNLKKT